MKELIRWIGRSSELVHALPLEVLQNEGLRTFNFKRRKNKTLNAEVQPADPFNLGLSPIATPPPLVYVEMPPEDPLKMKINLTPLIPDKMNERSLNQAKAMNQIRDEAYFV